MSELSEIHFFFSAIFYVRAFLYLVQKSIYFIIIIWLYMSIESTFQASNALNIFLRWTTVYNVYSEHTINKISN